jgi:hypothetical protein
MIDRYTKIVLTIIAVALSAIAVQGAIGSAQAQFGNGCGSFGDPCYVDAGLSGLPVYIVGSR